MKVGDIVNVNITHQRDDKYNQNPYVKIKMEVIRKLINRDYTSL